MFGLSGIFSIFNIVSFKNDPCVSVTNDLTGTCTTEQDCSDMSGMADGNCAAGNNEHL